MGWFDVKRIKETLNKAKSPASYADYANILGGSARQKLGGAIGAVGTAFNMPEFGISEAIAAPGQVAGARDWTQYDSPAGPTNPNNNPAPGNKTSNLSSGGGSDSSSGGFDSWFRGVRYTDANAYQNAVNTASLQEFTKQKAALDRAYNEGIITFEQRKQAIDQNRTAITEQRDKTLQAQAGYFSNISPEALQSQQGEMAGQTQKSYLTGQSSLNQAENTMNTQKGNYMADMLDQIAQLQNTFQSAKDQLANQLVDYTNRVSAPEAQNAYSINPQDILNQFSNQTPTTQLPVASAAMTGSTGKTTAQQVQDLMNFLYPQTTPAK